MRAMHPADRTYRNQVIRLADLTVTEDVISNVTFESCTIIGPAVVLFDQGTQVRRSGWTGPVEGVLWPLGERTVLVGAVILAGCVVESCRFERVGLAFLARDEQVIREGFGLG